MKDFDAQFAERAGKDEGFILQGHRFKIEPGVHPSVLIGFESTQAFSQEETQEAIDEAVKAFLTSDEDRTKWDELRAVTTPPERVISYAHMRAVMVYLYEVEAEIPTIAPALSSNTRGRESQSSGQGTSSPEATAS